MGAITFSSAKTNKQKTVVIKKVRSNNVKNLKTINKIRTTYAINLPISIKARPMMKVRT